MKRFKFRFEKLLLIKVQKEFEAKLKYSKVLQQKINLEQQNIIMKNRISSIIKTTEVDNENRMDIARMHFLEEQLSNLKFQIMMNNEKKENLSEELNKLRNELMEATKNKKIIEKLKEKDMDKYKKEAKTEEIKKIDETAGRRFIIS